MSRRLLLVAGLLSAALMLVGLLGVDRPLAEWMRASGLTHAAFFTVGLGWLDRITGLRTWYFLAGCVGFALGLAGWALRGRPDWSRILMAASVVQVATIGTMVIGKMSFGRLRPGELLDSGDWSHWWFTGGGSFPSGHSSFYFGLCLPLAAGVRNPIARVALLVIPVYAVLARLNMERHFLSDVTASALVAALYALAAAWLLDWLQHRRDPRYPGPGP